MPTPMKRHPIFTVPNLDFIPHAIGSDEARASCVMPSPGELRLWRFRADWHLVSCDDARAWLSPAERHRSKHLHSDALPKRFLVSRTVLRRILSRMLDRPPEAIALSDSDDGQPRLLATQPSVELSIHIATAGIWVIIGISTTCLGIGTVIPSPGSSAGAATMMLDLGALPQSSVLERLFPDVCTDRQQRARCTSMMRLAAKGWLPLSPVLTSECVASSTIVNAHGECCHVLDVPMPGTISAAVALTQNATRVDAFGWLKN